MGDIADIPGKNCEAATTPPQSTARPPHKKEEAPSPIRRRISCPRLMNTRAAFETPPALPSPILLDFGAASTPAAPTPIHAVAAVATIAAPRPSYKIPLNSLLNPVDVPVSAPSAALAAASPAALPAEVSPVVSPAAPRTALPHAAPRKALPNPFRAAGPRAAPPARLPCPECRLTFATKQSLSTHRKTVHIGTECRWGGCGRHFNHTKDLAIHLKHHQEAAVVASIIINGPADVGVPPQHICGWPSCGRRIRDKGELWRHIKCHNSSAA
ncbi:hypothetical protein F5B19DRAFT_492692 [Rostrohypoxylon terebratum]|nr:hypothetical protein F5B19DRAFT_492692 [Rostrohypoxylon terebratum]